MGWFLALLGRLLLWGVMPDCKQFAVGRGIKALGIRVWYFIRE